MLGSVCLDNDIKLVNIKPEDGDGFKNVIAIETDDDSQKLYVRFETFDKMKAWMLDIKSEAQSVSFAPSDASFMDWWKVIFGDVSSHHFLSFLFHYSFFSIIDPNHRTKGSNFKNPRICKHRIPSAFKLESLSYQQLPR